MKNKLSCSKVSSLKKGTVKISKLFKHAILRKRDFSNITYYTKIPFDLKIKNTLGLLSAVTLHNFNSVHFLVLINHYLSHRFDLLGSGWVHVYHGMECRGLEGYRYDIGQAINVDRNGDWLADRINSSNLDESQRIWKLIDPEYIPIDWHIDFKSGYRWSEKTWFKDIRYGHKHGVDIKVPWELARMQHLPQMAIAYATAVQSSKLKAESYREQQDSESEKNLQCRFCWRNN